MPLTRITCPHCEQSVEVNMTSVTRSRECPLCGQNILLQFTTQQKRQRRKALLTPAVSTDGGGAGEPGMPAGLSVNPKPIEGDVRERMMLDPEVRQRVRVIKFSVAALIVIIAVVVLGSMFHWWSGIADYVQEGVKQIKAPKTATGVEPTRDHDSGTKPGDSSSGKITFPNVSGGLDSEQALAQDQAAVSKVAVSFLNAPNVEERLNFILGRKTAESRMRTYYQHHPDGPVPFESIESLGPDSTDKMVFSLTIAMKDGGRRKMVLRKSVSKGYLVDWPSFVIYSEMDWADFLSQKPKRPLLFRLMASVSDDYRNEFVDPKKYVCLKLSNPLDVHAPPIFAYALRAASLGHVLEFTMSRAAGVAVPLTLKLRFPDSDGAPDQVWVDDFVAEGWVTQIW